MIDLDALNENQRTAVEWSEGPLLVLAGPGSGKTRVLTHRIARLIGESPGEHFGILGLTFTNKAAKEMRERIRGLVPDAGDRAHLTTFHSFAAGLLRQHGSHVGLKPDFEILAQNADRRSLLDEAIGDAAPERSGTTGEKLLPMISWLTEKNIAPGEAAAFLKGAAFDDSDALAAIYRRYRKLMIDGNTLDFAGLIAEALTLLERVPGIRAFVREVYPHVCVDEFQDTNCSQYRILKHVVDPKTRNLFVVADDDQMIYQWNGASPRRLDELEDDFGVGLLQLPENYRCPPAVVELANNLIRNNAGRFPGKDDLAAHKQSPDDSAVVFMKFDDFAREAEWVAQNISERPDGERTGCVVLARRRRLLEEMVGVLDEHGVRGYLASRKNEFASAPLQWLHSVLRLANSRSSRRELERVCKSFFSLEGIGSDAGDIVSHASAGSGDYLRSWASSVLNRDRVRKDTRDFIMKALIPILLERLDVWTFQKRAFGWLDMVSGAAADTADSDDAFGEYREEKGTWNELVEDIAGKHGRDEVTLHLLLQELDLRSKSPAPPEGAVPCYTIHASKGMEFDHVYLVGMVEDELPSWAAAAKRDDGCIEMQEERRNCFVAITRAKETLTLTLSDSVHGWSKTPSRFLAEMGFEMEGVDMPSRLLVSR